MEVCAQDLKRKMLIKAETSHKSDRDLASEP